MLVHRWTFEGNSFVLFVLSVWDVFISWFDLIVPDGYCSALALCAVWLVHV